LSTLTFWLGRATAALIVVAVAAAAISLGAEHDSPGRVALRRYVGELNRLLRFVRLKAVGGKLAAAQALLGIAIIGLAATKGPVIVLLALPVVVLAPKVCLEWKAARRITAVEEQLEPWIGAVANALKASTSLGEAIASTTRLVPAPMSEEIDLVVKEYELGTPLDEAMQKLAERIPSKTVAGAVLAIKVARKSGGNLPEMLENAGAALRELARLEGVVRSKTAEGKAQAFVIALLPLPMVGGIHVTDPGFFDPLTKTFVGELVIGGAAVLWAVAILLARKILAVDV
jgi:tight adherence protein B